jgi:hypothetical protein
MIKILRNLGYAISVNGGDRDLNSQICGSRRTPAPRRESGRAIYNSGNNSAQSHHMAPEIDEHGHRRGDFVPLMLALGSLAAPNSCISVCSFWDMCWAAAWHRCLRSCKEPASPWPPSGLFITTLIVAPPERLAVAGADGWARRDAEQCPVVPQAAACRSAHLSRQRA